MNASGVVQCGTPTSPIPLAECTPWDIIGGPSTSSPEVLKYVMSTGQSTYGSTVNSATVDLGGELFTLPAGAIGIAGGLEHREVKGYDRPGQFEQSGYSTDLAGNATIGRYTVKEAYAELNVPVLKGKPFAELLSFNLATRHSDYSNFGSTTNSKASFMYKPVKDVLTRGTYAEGFRAPSVGDTFGGGSQSFDTGFLDPCDTQFGSASRDPAVLARCIAAGTSATFRQPTQTGVITSSAGGQTPYPFQSGAGNAALQPETAVTKTLGLVYSPSFLPGFSAALDWFNIQIDNRITAVSSTYIANQCYVANLPEFCTSIKRDKATGAIIDLARGNANLGQMRTEGVDLELKYRLPRTSFGQFGVRSETSYLDSFEIKSSAAGEWVNYAGEYDYHRVKSNLNIDWSLGNWNATWGMRYLSSVKDQCYNVSRGLECNSPNTKVTWSSVPGANILGSLTYHDINVGYKTAWNGHIALGINNAFDKKPRWNVRGAASSSMVDADLPIDRFFYVRYNQSF